MNGPSQPEGGLARAAGLFLARLQQAEPEPVEAFLRRHAELREWLEPMLAAGQDPAAAAATPAAGEPRRLGPFRLLREIGRGGMGVVYEARRGDDDRPVAVKVLPGFLALQPDRAARFAREAEVARPFVHPGIVQVLDAGEAGDTHWLAMEFVVGAPLDAVLEALAGRRPEELGAEDLGAAVRDRLHVPAGVAPPATSAFAGSYVAAIVRLARQLADALGHLHAAGVVHRDVKPSNVLLGADGRVVLTDFGLARPVHGTSLTHTGDFAGTPNYVSPEQAMAKRVPIDHRSDLFSLGSTLYELLTLQKAFPGATTPEVLGRILSKEPAPPARCHPGLPGDLVAVLGKLLEKDPDRRYHDAQAVVADLDAFLAYRPVQAKRASSLTRVWRWTRREPLRAALVGVLAIAVPALTAGAGYLWARADEIREGREQLRSRQVEALVDGGFLAAIQEDASTACARFEQALALDRTSPEAAIGLVLALLRRDGPEVALRQLDERLAPTLPPNLLALLRYPLLHRLERPETDVLREQLPAPRSAFELFLHGLLERDIHATAGTRLLEYVEQAVLASERPHLWLHLQWAVFAEAAGDAASCRRCASNLLANWPASPMARYFVCLALRRVEPERALQLARDGLAADPNDGLAHWAEALVLQARGDLPGTIAALERTVALLPGAPSAHYALGKAWFEQGEHARALAAMQKARDLSPRFVEAWLAVGMCERKLGHLDAALAALQHAVALHATYGDARFQLGQLLVQRGDLPGGLRQLEKAVALHPGDPNKWHHLAFARFATGDDVQGEDALRRAVAANPGYERAHAVLVMCLEERGTPTHVREVLAAWVQALPDSAEGWLQYGRHCLRTDLGPELLDAPTAVWAAKRALAITRERSGAAWLLLGEAHHRLVEVPRAQAALQQALTAAMPLAPPERARCELLLATLATPGAGSAARPEATGGR